MLEQGLLFKTAQDAMQNAQAMITPMEPDARIIELAERMLAPGSKCAALSMSEVHEVAHYILGIE